MILFISDLHLSEDQPAITAAFVDFLSERAVDADTLYILGDFFETWIGDDDDSELATVVTTALRQLSDSGTAIYLQHGNRDFLIGEQFCEASGSTLISDPTVVDLYGKSVLLMHGDSLCIDDADYMEFRSQVRSPEWQSEFLGQSLQQRRAIAQQLRDASKNANSNKADAIMDVNAGEVTRVFQAHGVDLMIHGHTHRPFIHDHVVSGKAVTRIVLGDWGQNTWVLSYLPDHSFNLDKNKISA